MRFASAVLCGVSAVMVGQSALHAAVVPLSSDTYLTRNQVANNSSDVNIAVVNRSVPGGTSTGDQNNLDRVGLLKFDLTNQLTSGPLTSATLQLRVGNNALPASFDLQVWGIPETLASENYNESTITFANAGFGSFGYSATGTATADATDNNVVDANLTLLADYIFPATAGNQNTFIQISDPRLLNFLNADTDNVASFVLTTPTQTSGTTSTAVFNSSNNTTDATFGPSLTVSSVPEPTTLGALGLVSAALVARRRRA